MKKGSERERGFPPDIFWHMVWPRGDQLAVLPVEDNMRHVFNNSEIFARHNRRYCVWIRGGGESAGGPLVAVWIDPTMQSYEDRLGTGLLEAPVSNEAATPHQETVSEEASAQEAHSAEDGPGAASIRAV